MNARIFLSIALLTTVSTHAQTLIVGDAPSSSGEAAILHRERLEQMIS